MKKVITIAACILAALLPHGINAEVDCNDFNKEPEKKMLELISTQSESEKHWDTTVLNRVLKNNLPCLKKHLGPIENVDQKGRQGSVTLDFLLSGIGRDKKDYAIQVLIDPSQNYLSREISKATKKLAYDWKPQQKGRSNGDYRARWILVLNDEKDYWHCGDLMRTVNKEDGKSCPDSWEQLTEVGTADFSEGMANGKRTVWAKRNTSAKNKSKFKVFSIVCIEMYAGACSRNGITLAQTNDSIVKSD